jgi:hypothetical protein
VWTYVRKKCVPGPRFVAAGTAQAAPVSGGVLGHLTTAKQASVAVEQVGWRRHQPGQICARPFVPSASNFREVGAWPPI